MLSALHWDSISSHRCISANSFCFPPILASRILALGHFHLLILPCSFFWLSGNCHGHLPPPSHVHRQPLVRSIAQTGQWLSHCWHHNTAGLSWCPGSSPLALLLLRFHILGEISSSHPSLCLRVPSCCVSPSHAHLPHRVYQIKAITCNSVTQE